MSAALAVQKAIRARLTSTPNVGVLVPAANILDRNARPNPVPSIIIGEDQEVEGERIARDSVRVYSTLHVWVKETGTTGAKAIAGAIRSALAARISAASASFHIADCRVTSTRFLRDPDGETSHGVVMIETLVHEVQA